MIIFPPPLVVAAAVGFLQLPSAAQVINGSARDNWNKTDWLFLFSPPKFEKLKKKK
jgi:hypothetical protein